MKHRSAKHWRMLVSFGYLGLVVLGAYAELTGKDWFYFLLPR